MKISILTLFPQTIRAPLSESMMKRAQDKGLLDVKVVYIRDYAAGRHQVTDDYPYGGGAGLVMKPEPIFGALEAALGISVGAGGDSLPEGTRVIMMCPQGELFSQRKAWELSKAEHLLFICGHYEGVDERVRSVVTDEISIGDYVLTGGELPALVVTDAVVRLVPGVLAGESPHNDSFAHGILEGPQYTRPREFRGLAVPEILVCGHHEMVRLWRRKEGLRRTRQRRPDLLLGNLSEEDRRLLDELDREERGEGNRYGQ